jgi:hypothetical protein
MNLLLIREYDSGSETIGKIYFKTDKLRFVHTLEDTYNEHKIPGSTRIPPGQYELTLTKSGNFFEKYSEDDNKKIAEFTRKYGVMVLNNVPNFSSVMVHCGNFNKDSRGCLLVGDSVNNPSYSEGMITNSKIAYAYLISNIFPAFNTSKVILNILDSDREIKKQFA